MTFAVVPFCAMLAPCSMLSRTLRAGYAGAASGILDSICARRSAHRQVGTKGWLFQIEQRDGLPGRKRSGLEESA
jgi:hypothetical protein